MNERIRELYNQSFEEKYQYGGSDAKPGEMYSNYITVLNPEKFAQLIVQECADLFVDQKYMILNPHEPFANERVRVLKEHDKDTVRTIKRHFGVKE